MNKATSPFKRSRWLGWQPPVREFGETTEDVPTKPTESGSDGFVGTPSGISQKIEHEPMESVLKGKAVELSSDASGRLFIVADEEDAQRLMADGVSPGEIYTAAEARRVIQIGDPATVAEIHEWKRRFDGVIR